MYLPEPNESNFTPPPAGTHLAVCTRIIDLGTQKTTYQGETKVQHKLMLTWELPDEQMEDGRPFTISKRYTWSMSDKATLRKHLEAWRGQAFKPSDFGPGGFDLKNVLGKGCVLSITQDEKDGKVYANIASVGKLMKGTSAPPTINEQVYFWLHEERFDPEVYARLSEGLRGIISGSPEYGELIRIRNGELSDHDAHNMRESDLDDDIPF